MQPIGALKTQYVRGSEDANHYMLYPSENGYRLRSHDVPRIARPYHSSFKSSLEAHRPRAFFVPENQRKPQVKIEQAPTARWLRYEAVRRRYGIGKSSLMGLVRRGQLHPSRPSPRVTLFDARELDSLIQSATTTTTRAQA